MGLFPKNLNEYLALQGIPRGPYSQVYIVDPANGSDSNPGTSFTQPLRQQQHLQRYGFGVRHPGWDGRAARPSPEGLHVP